MFSSFQKISIFICAYFVFLEIGYCQSHGTLHIYGYNFSNEKGVMRYGVFDKEDHFLQPEYAYVKGQSVIKQGEARAVVSLPPGKYAVTLLHDENNDDAMSRRFGIPREGFGVSKVTRRPLWEPQFKDCIIEIKSNETTAIAIPIFYIL